MEADMPPPPVYAPIKNVNASPIVKAIKNGQLSLQQITNISAYLSKRTAFQPSVKDGELGDAVVDFLNKNEVDNETLQRIIDQLPKQNVMYTGPGMKETKNKTKMNKKDLMEMIREVIAEEMGSSATDVNNYKVMLDYNPLKFTVSTKDAKALEGTRAGAYLNSKFNTSTFDENKKYEVSTFEQREEISKVLNEAEGNYTIVSWRGPGGDSYPQQMDSKTAKALSALGTTDLRGKTVGADVWMGKLRGVTPTGELGDWLESSMGENLNITIDPKAGKVTLKRESELAKTRDAISSREKANRADSLARMGLK